MMSNKKTLGGTTKEIGSVLGLMTSIFIVLEILLPAGLVQPIGTIVTGLVLTVVLICIGKWNWSIALPTWSIAAVMVFILHAMISRPATVVGAVVDGSGSPMPEVKLVLTDSSGVDHRSVMDKNGTFEIKNVPEGKFTISANGELLLSGRVPSGWERILKPTVDVGILVYRPAITVVPTPTNTLAPMPTSASTPTLTLTPPPGTISDFNDGTTQGWLAAHWSYTETAISVLPSDQAGSPSGALWGNFDFGRTQSDWPRATFYLTLPSGSEDWTSTVEVRFDAQALPATGGDVKATVIVKTTGDFCYNEHGEFQHVGRTWTTLTFPLHVEQYKNCEDSDGYDAPLIAGDRVVELAVVFVPSPDDARFAGEVLIDNVVRLVQQP